MKIPRRIAGAHADPLYPKTPVTVGGKLYNLCFDFGALAESETAINTELAANESAERVNLLMALPVLNLANTRTLFAASLRVFHPEISFEEARALLTFEDLYEVALKIQSAFVAAQPEAQESERPPQAGPKAGL